jgi:hypothetical protein
MPPTHSEPSDPVAIGPGLSRVPAAIVMLPWARLAPGPRRTVPHRSRDIRDWPGGSPADQSLLKSRVLEHLRGRRANRQSKHDAGQQQKQAAGDHGEKTMR